MDQDPQLIDPENGNYRVSTGGVAAAYGCQTFSDGIEEGISVALDFSLTNFPNPFNPTTKISYQLPETGNVRLVVFNSRGELVWNMAEQKVEAGKYSIDFNGEQLKSGIYFCRLTVNEKSDVQKMVLVR